MTETEKMLAILRERGVEYREVNSMVTDIDHDGIKTRVYDYDDGPDYQLCVEQKWLTAEEAVRAALGIKQQEVLERRIDELCIENQRLLEEVMWLEAALEGMHIINDRYRADYARLTEFAEDAYSFAYNCYHGVCEQETFLRLRAKRNELRELGVEVPDGS